MSHAHLPPRMVWGGNGGRSSGQQVQQETGVSLRSGWSKRVWIFTKYGFFSAVCTREKNGTINPDRLKVRARRRSDLVALCKRFPNKLTGVRIFTDEKADYRYRMFVSKRLWTDLLTELADEMDYDNFKGACAEEEYHDSLTHVWSVMHHYQETEGQPTYRPRIRRI